MFGCIKTDLNRTERIRCVVECLRVSSTISTAVCIEQLQVHSKKRNGKHIP